MGWFAILCLGGLIVAVFATSPHLIWGGKRAAFAITLADYGVILHYPEGTQVARLWTNGGLLFDLYDTTRAAPFRRVLPTDYFIGDRTRLSALTREAFDDIMSEARTRGIVRPKKPERYLFSPTLSIPDSWSVSGKSSGTPG